MRTIDLTGVAASGNPTMTFWTSYDTEADWDFVFVEAHPVGPDDWTTLPDVNGHTSQSTGPNELDLASCPAAGTSCIRSSPTTRRPTASAHARRRVRPASGTLHPAAPRGWEQWEIDLSAYAGQQVEISLSYASDWAVQGLGNFLDDIQVSHGGGSTSFETGPGRLDAPGPPEGSAPNPNDYIRTESVGFEEGAVVSTDDTLYFGFGFEGITNASVRNAVMDASMDYLIGP